MPVFYWETVTANIARTWPQSGPVFKFFLFWTDYSESRWISGPFLIFLAVKIGWRKLIIPSLLAIMAIGLGDLLSRRVVKSLIMRPRPNFVGMECHISKCWGFVSSHSTNMMAAAIVLTLYDRKNAIWSIPVALVICFSRIYLVDHFALDVLGGMALGTGVAFSVWGAYRFIQERIQPAMIEKRYS